MQLRERLYLQIVSHNKIIIDVVEFQPSFQGFIGI